MSLFDDSSDDDDEYYYEPDGAFQLSVLQNADKVDQHPMEYIAERQAKALTAMDSFIEQDTHITKSERIALQSDIEEAREAISRACKVIPAEVVNDG